MHLDAVESMGASETNGPIAAAAARTIFDGARLDVADTVFRVDRYSQPTRITDARGFFTEIVYSASYPALQVNVKDPPGRELSFVYDASGRLSQATDLTHSAGAATTTYDYGETGAARFLPTLIDEPRDGVHRDITRFSYNAQALPDTIIDPRGHRTTFTYDAGRVSTTTEHDVGVWVSETTPDSIQDLTWQFGYETALGNLATVTTPLGNVTQYVYDAAGQLTQAVSPTGDSTFYGYSPRGRMDSVWFAIEDRHDRYRIRYDDEGNRIALFDPRDVPRFWSYDSAGRQVTMTDERGEVEFRYFDPAGNLIKRIDRQGDSIWSVYSARNLETTRYVGEMRIDSAEAANELYASANVGALIMPGDTVEFAYDAVGRLLSAENRKTRIARQYTPEGSVARDSQYLHVPTAREAEFNYTYHPSSARASLVQNTPSSSLSVSYGIGPLSQLEEITTGGDTVRISYDALGARDVVAHHFGLETQFRLDADRRLREAATLHADTLVARELYTQYDAAARPLAMLESGGHLEPGQIDTHRWRYDARGRLTYTARESAFDEMFRQYTYDLSSNRRLELRCPLGTSECADSISYHYLVAANGNPTNRVRQRRHYSSSSLQGHLFYTHDDNGNLIRETDFIAVEDIHRIYDPQGRLVDIAYESARADTTFFAYDAFNRRLKGAFGAPRAYTFYDGNNPANFFGAEFVHGSGVDDPLIALLPNDFPCPASPNGYFATVNGRLLAFTDSAGADCIYTGGSSRIPTNAWAGYAVEAGAIRDSRTFNLERAGDVTELSYFRNRYYDAKIGRFTQEDPLGFAGGLNLYAYAGNNPASYTDPFGLCPDCIFDVLAIGADLNDIRQNGLSWGRGIALGVDIAAAALPFVPAVGGAGVRSLKGVNLPSWRRIDIDMGHISSGHMRGGARVGSRKDLFPEGMSASQVERTVRDAYRHSKRIRTQGDRVLVRGESGGLTIEMWVNRESRMIETAYPINR